MLRLKRITDMEENNRELRQSNSDFEKYQHSLIQELIKLEAQIEALKELMEKQ